MSLQSFSQLTQFSLLAIEGPDAERFLQGQLTCDVVRLPLHHWTLGACCTAKGRMVANFVIARTEQGFWLRLPKEQVAALCQHLAKYAVFFKASLKDKSESHAVIGKIPEHFLPKLNSQPAPFRQISADIELHWADGRIERWLPISEVEQAKTEDGSWSRCDIEQGLIWVNADSREAWVPQQIDWHKQGGVSFKKGCYTGQEIVARLEYLGKSKKILLQLQSPICLEAKTLANLEDEHGQALGELASWQKNQGLAIAPIDVKQLFLQGQKLSVKELFYELNNAREL